MNQCPYCGKYLLDEEECYCDKRGKYNNKDDKETSPITKVILTAIIYPCITLIIALATGPNEHPILSVYSVLLTILAVACIIISGVYLLIIPLPIIFYYHIGAIKSKFPLWLRIVCGILALIFMFCSITIFYFDELGIILY